jgi:hypothetical protein
MFAILGLAPVIKIIFFDWQTQIEMLQSSA